MYFLKKSSFELTDKSIEILINREFSKKERMIFKYLVSKISISTQYIEFLLNDLVKHLSFKSSDELFKSLDRLMSRRVTFKISKGDVVVSKGSCGILDSYIIEDDTIYIALSKEIMLSTTPNNLFNRISLNNCLSFEHDFSKKLFLEIIKDSSRVEGSLLFKIDDFKNFFHIDKEKYSRFYDIERFFLKNMSNDINKNTSYTINFEKVRSGIERSNRVTHIKIYFVNEYQKMLSDETNRLMSLASSKIKDFGFIYSQIRSSIKVLGLLFTEKLVIEAISSADFDKTLIDLIKVNSSK